MANSVNEVRKNLIEKYRPTLAAMAAAGEEGDMSVLFDKLKYAANNRGKEGTDTYAGIPEDFNYEEFLEDAKGLE